MHALLATRVKILEFIVTTLLLFDVQGMVLLNTLLFNQCIFGIV